MQDGLTPEEFERAVGEALQSLPKRFADLVENVAIAIQDEPNADDLGRIEHRVPPHSEVLGLYSGVPLTRRTHYMPMMPDAITLFRGPITRVTRTRAEAVRQIRDTVIHELGHYFGLSDDEMPH
ncbi:MAG TPA: metallopeptidase family protein [Candidatus Baltobacteraceae bacterium]|nr:metallopeptidase family protein [Candidatus Baltobacteraceae bacterium]